MSLPLVKKELRDQRPFLILALFLGALEPIDDLLRSEFGVVTLGGMIPQVAGSEGALFLFVFAFAVASGLLTREREDRTLEFLEALPLTRTRIFLVKGGVALGTVLLYPFLTCSWIFVGHLASRTSLDPHLHLGPITTLFGLLSAVALFGVALSLVLSHLGRLNWLALSICLLAMVALEQRLPWLSQFNPLELTRPRYEGTDWKIPWAALRWQLPMVCAFLLAAWALFSQGAERMAKWLEDRLARAGGVIAILTGIVLLAVVILKVKDDPEQLDDEAENALEITLRDYAPVQFDTRFYGFRFPGNQQEQARALIGEADQTFQGVFGYFPSAKGSGLIVTELGGSARHTAGTAAWESIRMSLSGTTEDVRATLAHETVHVLASRIVGVKAAPKWDQFSVLNEGLAMWVTQQLHPNPEEQEADRFIAAAMRARAEVRLEELIDSELLQTERDWTIAYPLGTLLVQALVDRGGVEAPHRLLEALPLAPPELKGLDLWQYAFQEAGANLPSVMDSFFAQLDREVALRKEALDALPRPYAALEKSEDWVGVRVVLEAALPEGWEAVCRFRASDQTSRFRYDGPEAVDPENPICWRRSSQVGDGLLRFQLGIRDEAGRTIYEPWEKMPVD